MCVCTFGGAVVEDEAAEGEEGEEEEADNGGRNDGMSSLIGALGRLYSRCDFYQLNVNVQTPIHSITNKRHALGL